MRSRLPIVLLATVACAPRTPPVAREATPPLTGERHPTAIHAAGNTLTLANAAFPDRAIVRRPLGVACPAAADGWFVEPLFQDVAGYLPPGLARYCVFDRDRSFSGTVAQLATFGEAGPDLLVVAGMTTPTLEESLAESFVDQVKPFPDFTTLPTDRARLTFVDSSPTALAGDPDVYEVAGTYGHGQQLATLALRAVCDGDLDATATPDCVVDLASQLALGYTNEPTGFERSTAGGLFGSQADLAVAIQRAVLAWHEDEVVGRLVLSVALGWHPGSGGPEEDPEPGVLAVMDALKWASCEDVLVVAAVGNVDTPWDEPLGAEPLYPAHWEDTEAPTETECASLFGTWFTQGDRNRLAGTATYTPLIYGVSGIDVDGRTLAHQRPDASTPHTAAGSHLVAYNPGVGAHLPAISGTSASTAVVGAAAAVVRSHFPHLNVHEVMEVLREASPTGETAEFCHDEANGACPASAQITVCDALAHACAVYGSCPASYATACEDLPDAVPLVPTDAPAPDTVTIDTGNRVACGTGTALLDADLPAVDFACPWEELYGATTLPMTLPQPGGNECPLCPAFLPNRIDLDMKAPFETFEDLTITVYRPGLPPNHYPLGPLFGDKFTVFLPSGALDNTVDKVVLSYTYLNGDTMSYVEPLYLTWQQPPQP